MTDQHPITPPPELLLQLEAAWFKGNVNVGDLLTTAYQAGADQELEACCKDIIEIIAGVFADRVIDDWDQFVELLRDGRRPKPPSLKEQALATLPEHPENMASYLSLSPGNVALIRRALEALDD